MASDAPGTARAPRPVKADLPVYLASRAFGTTGIQIQSLAIGWEVYDRTGRALDLGWVGLAQFLPLMLLSLPAGAIADRLDRKAILAVCRVVYTIGALALAFDSRVGTPDASLLPTFAVLTLLGATRAFSFPAASALLPSLVTIDRLPRAIAMSSTTFQVATIGGPALGGVIYALGGAEAAYLTAASCLAVSAVCVFSLRTPMRERAPTTEGAVQRVAHGLRYVFRERVLLGAISLDLFAVLLGGAVALMPIFARDILHVGETGLGMLRSAPAAGAAATAIFFAFFPMKRHAGRLMFSAVALFGAATIAFGLSESFALSLASLAILGGADMVSVVIRQSLIQLRTPDEMRGRVSSVSYVFIGASNELGEFESGVTAAWLGTVRAVVLGGIGTLLVTGIWASAFPDLRNADRLDAPPPGTKS